MERGSKVYVAGHRGLLGSAVCRALESRGEARIVARTREELDLRDARAVDDFFRAERPDHVVLAAAMAGGIGRNRAHPAEMIAVNLAIQSNVIDAAHRWGARRLLFVASACSYPRACDGPIGPEMLLAGPLEPTSEPFAVAKIAGIRMCRAYNEQYGTRFVTAIPATLYGPNDHFDENGHVVAALLGRFHEARVRGAPEVSVWGTGRSRREFLYVDDAAEALLFLLDRPEADDLVNVGPGDDVSIADLAALIARAVGFEGAISFDAGRPDGMPRRLLDSRRIHALGWAPRVTLEEGLARTYAWLAGRPR